MDPLKDPADAKAMAGTCGPECGPNCGPECGPEHSDDLPEPTPDIPPLPESRLTQVADTLVLMMFIVGVYSQIFSLFLYAFGNTA